MELRHLKYFQALAEELHFGKAAKRLFISQPPLSRQIKELEDNLGVLLFERTSKSVRLTPAGAFFYKETVRILKQLQQLQQETQQIHHAVTGDIRIAYISATDKVKVAELMRLIKESYPRLHVYLYELSSEKQVQALQQGKLDFGILRAPILSKDVHWIPLFQDSFCLALPAFYKDDIVFRDLGNQSFITYNRAYAPNYFNQILACCAQLGFDPTINQESNTVASILELVHHGLGISIVPASVVKQYQHLSVRFIALPTDIQSLVALGQPDRKQSALQQQIQQFIVDLFV
ncbi:LysR family transcriptional regulator [Sphingobacterium sp. Mn56C]|uniref:LysR family transcriptional regulator n=1 Tax=Sphingobacterium sp. Mn56C TaxID=3395261 RepID=UPI003BC44EF0